MKSRLAQDRYGRTIGIVSVRTLPGVELNHHYIVVGDTIASAGTRIFFLANETRRASRPATGRERAESQRHAPYRPALSRQEREQQQVPDELLPNKPRSSSHAESSSALPLI